MVLQNANCQESIQERNNQGTGGGTPVRRVGTASTMGGVACEGRAPLYELYKLVYKVRACLQAAAMDSELLAMCKAKYDGGIGSADGG